jgi:outer membrane protein
MSMKFTKSALAAALAGSLLAGVAQAYEAGNWIGRVGAWGILPKSDSLKSTILGTIGVDNSYSPGLNLTYMATPNIGIELIAALPFKHDITLSGTKVASTYQLPPTIFVQYHFMPSSNVRPYAGVGLNYTFFWDEKTTGALLPGTSLNLSSSWGAAGVDIDIAHNWFMNTVVSYMDIDTKAKSNTLGTLGTVNIDPFVVGINIGTRF